MTAVAKKSIRFIKAHKVIDHNRKVIAEYKEDETISIKAESGDHFVRIGVADYVEDGAQALPVSDDPLKSTETAAANKPTDTTKTTDPGKSADPAKPGGSDTKGGTNAKGQTNTDAKSGGAGSGQNANKTITSGKR